MFWYSTAAMRASNRCWNNTYTDPKLYEFFFRRGVRDWTTDPPQYNYWWVSLTALGVFIGMCQREFFYTPSFYFSGSSRRQNVVDRQAHLMRSIPHYNHYLRNYSLKWRATVIDNEPDYASEHPLGYRPNRQLEPRRYFLFLNSPRYSTDALTMNALHANMEKHYEELGYHPDRVKSEEDDD